MFRGGLTARGLVAAFIIASTCCNAFLRIPSIPAIADKMNTAADPCEDFYEYACGGYLESHTVPVDQYGKSILFDLDRFTMERIADILDERITWFDSDLEKMAKRFYKSCMRPENSTVTKNKALDYVSPAGQTWPTFDPTWTEAQYDLEATLAAANRLDNNVDSDDIIGGFIRGVVYHDWDNGVYKPWVIAGDFLVGDNYKVTPELEDAYESLVIDTLILLGADPAVADADGKAISDFEKQLRSLTHWSYAEMTLENLTSTLPYLDWHTFLNMVMEEVGIDHEIQADDIIRVNDLDYFLGLPNFIGDISKRTLINDIKWRMFTALVPAMPDDIRQRFVEFEAIQNGVQGLSERSIHCARVVSSISQRKFLLPGRTSTNTLHGVGDVVSRMFVEKYQDLLDRIIDESAELEGEIKSVILQALEDNEWLSPETKVAFLNKVTAQQALFGYPDYILDDSYMNDYYRDFVITRFDFFQNFVNSLEGNVRRGFETLIQAPSVVKWDRSPAVVMDWNTFFTNEIIYTAAFIQPGTILKPGSPFFGLHYPRFMNYAGLGFFIGQQTTHSIDWRGTGIDEFGVRGKINSAFSTDAFWDRAWCTIQQYGTYIKPYTNETVYSWLSSVENIADLTGVKFSYIAYEEFLQRTGETLQRWNLGYLGNHISGSNTLRKLFFISYAQNFCEIFRPEVAEHDSVFGPGKWRVNGPLRNFPKFAEVYECPLDSFMNPFNTTERCEVF